MICDQKLLNYYYYYYRLDVIKHKHVQNYEMISMGYAGGGQSKRLFSTSL